MEVIDGQYSTHAEMKSLQSKCVYSTWSTFTVDEILRHPTTRKNLKSGQLVAIFAC